eukprot:3026544-Prymnesium_polylepis.1
MIYCSHDGSKAAVRCQYDSAGGLALGDEFGNYMGALMGCVLSPESKNPAQQRAGSHQSRVQR